MHELHVAGEAAAALRRLRDLPERDRARVPIEGREDAGDRIGEITAGQIVERAPFAARELDDLRAAVDGLGAEAVGAVRSVDALGPVGALGSIGAIGAIGPVGGAIGPVDAIGPVGGAIGPVGVRSVRSVRSKRSVRSERGGSRPFSRRASNTGVAT